MLCMTLGLLLPGRRPATGAVAAVVGVVLLTGAGPAKDGKYAFCAGGDQKIRGDDGYIGSDEVASKGVGRLILAVPVGPPEILRELPGPGRRALFGFSGSQLPDDPGLLAVQLDEERSWQILHRAGSRQLTPFTGTQVVGVGRDPRQPAGTDPGLLLLDDDWRTLVLAGRSWTRKVATAAAEIEHVAVDPSSSRFAFATAAGDLTIGSFGHEGPIYRLLPGEPL